MNRTYTKKSKNTKKMSNNKYKKRTQNNNFKKPMTKSNKTEEPKHYKLPNLNDKDITHCNVYFKPTLLHRKFKISKKNRISLLNSLGLIPSNLIENEKFAKYYSNCEQKELCNIFDTVFNKIEKYVRDIKGLNGVYQKSTIRIKMIHWYIEFNFSLSYCLDDTRIVIFNLGECLKLICLYLKLKNFLEIITKSINENKFIKSIDSKDLSSINGFIYEDNNFSYGIFINNKEDKRKIANELKHIYNDIEYDRIEQIVKYPLNIKLFENVIHDSFSHVKVVQFNK